MNTFLLTVFLFVISLLNVTSQYKRVCYYTSWSAYRNGVGKFSLDKYQPGLCTHLIYAFGRVTYFPEENRTIISNYDINEDNGFQTIPDYVKMSNLKRSQPDLKILLAVGGWTHASRGFTEMVQTPQRRQQFINYAVSYLSHHKLDGLDFDWEYPAQRGSPTGDRSKYTELCKETKQAFRKYGFLLTAALGAGQGTVDQSYEMGEISKHLDFLNMMSYDLHGPWEGNVGHQTDSNEKLTPYQLSVWNSVDHYIRKGADPSKIVLGLASYGRTQRLRNKCDNGLGGKTTYSGGKTGRYTGESGFLAFYEICKLNFRTLYCTPESETNAPYGSVDNYFVGFDDELSIKYKVQNIMKGKNLGGYMFWALDLDDFNGICGGRKFPLMNMAKDLALGLNPSPTVICRSFSETNCIDDTPKPTPNPNGCRVNPDGAWAKRSGFDFETWCNNNCPGNKDQGTCGKPGSKDFCICPDPSAASPSTTRMTTTAQITTTTTTTRIPITIRKTTTRTTTTTIRMTTSTSPRTTRRTTQPATTIPRYSPVFYVNPDECLVNQNQRASNPKSLDVLKKYCKNNCQRSPCFTLSLYCTLPRRCLRG